MTVIRTRGRKSKALTALILHRDNYQCQLRLPGCTVRATVKDHIIPHADGGTDALHNLQAACEHCNRTKGSAPMGVFSAARGTGNASFRPLSPLISPITGDLTTVSRSRSQRR